MLIPTLKIRDSRNVRRIKPNAAAEAGFLASVRALGIQTPILVRPLVKGDSYSLVFGARRLAAAIAAGLTDIPAEVREMTDEQVRIAQAAENMARAAMHPIDQWRAVADMVDDETSIADAAAALGLDGRKVRQMEQLGRLHPDMLALIEATETPSARDLAMIARAPHETQEAALRVPHGFRRGEDGVVREVAWWKIAQACEVRRFSRSVAIFDHAAIAWDTDLFAEPGGMDEFTTTDAETFLRLQMQAVEALVAAAKNKKLRLATYLPDSLSLKLPSGFQHSYGDPEKLKRNEVVFIGVTDVNGQVMRRVGITEAAQPAGEAEDGGDDDFPSPPPPAPEKSPISKAGLDMIAALKTNALREALREDLAGTGTHNLVAMLILAFTAQNVRCLGLDEPNVAFGQHQFRDIAAQLMTPDGIVISPRNLADLQTHTGELLARLLRFAGPSAQASAGWESGPPANWIGRMIGADERLPRFDTAEFLQHVGGDELRRMATAEGKKSTGSVKDVRERLIGQLPDWRPTAAEFSAPAPVGGKAAGAKLDGVEHRAMPGRTIGQTEA